MSTELVLDGLSLTYPGASQPAVADLDIGVTPGSMVALLGPSGCGKTTTMKMIAGLLTPTSGDVRFDGESMVGVRPERRPVAMVFQKSLLFPHMTVRENVGFGLKVRKVPNSEIRMRVEEFLELVRLPGMADRRVGELSGGQEQRISLARALIVSPKILLLDEPLSALDANLRIEMRDLIRSVQEELDLTAVFVTHDQEEAVVLADRIALILDGRLQQYAEAADFYQRPASVRVARFFGTDNLVEGRFVRGCFESALGTFEVEGVAPDGPSVLAVRQEAVGLGPGPNQIDGTVDRTLYVGTHLRVWLRAGGTQLQCTVDPTAGVRTGEPLTVHIPPQHCWALPVEETS
ncbi:MAG: ABC transporter ATP-binding protein [Euzebyales bacterium]|nr:ABC transporter ATP-binding protein [Euzebyales bacterium]